MKPLIGENQDEAALLELGRASVQVIHDLKNQVNGLKLYATFLRKRLEKDQRPADELETVAKINAGLERAAADMTMLVRFGRPLELRRRAGSDLRQLLAAATGATPEADNNDDFRGDFDSTTITEALKLIDAGTRAHRAEPNEAAAARVNLRRVPSVDGTASAVVEWHGVSHDARELFTSFIGGDGLRLALAAKIIRAHGGQIAHEAGTVRVQLPLSID